MQMNNKMFDMQYILSNCQLWLLFLLILLGLEYNECRAASRGKNQAVVTGYYLKRGGGWGCCGNKGGFGRDLKWGWGVNESIILEVPFWHCPLGASGIFPLVPFLSWPLLCLGPYLYDLLRHLLDQIQQSSHHVIIYKCLNIYMLKFS